jgi:hypothetical protein
LDAAKPPRRLAAAAAVASARLGDVSSAEAYLKRALAKKTAQSLGTKARSSLVQALCMTPCRAPRALALALALLDEGSANGWLSAGARRALGLQLVQAARRIQANAAAGDDEACLLGRAVAAPLAPTGEDAGGDILPRDLYDDVVTPASALAWAECLADGAPRGRATRDALCAVAAIAYHVERDERRALDTVRAALRRGAGSRGSSVEESAPAVLRASYGRRSAGATATRPRKSSGSSNDGARRAARRRPWTCCSTRAPRRATSAARSTRCGSGTWWRRATRSAARRRMPPR